MSKRTITIFVGLILACGIFLAGGISLTRVSGGSCRSWSEREQACQRRQAEARPYNTSRYASAAGTVGE